MSVDEIIREAMMLPAAARARIAAELQASLDLPGEELTEEEWVAAWTPELTRRFKSVDDGTATLIPWGESVERIREHLKRRGQPRGSACFRKLRPKHVPPQIGIGFTIGNKP